MYNEQVSYQNIDRYVFGGINYINHLTSKTHAAITVIEENERALGIIFNIYVMITIVHACKYILLL